MAGCAPCAPNAVIPCAVSGKVEPAPGGALHVAGSGVAADDSGKPAPAMRSWTRCVRWGCLLFLFVFYIIMTIRSRFGIRLPARFQCCMFFITYEVWLLHMPGEVVLVQHHLVFFGQTAKLLPESRQASPRPRSIRHICHDVMAAANPEVARRPSSPRRVGIRDCGNVLTKNTAYLFNVDALNR